MVGTRCKSKNMNLHYVSSFSYFSFTIHYNYSNKKQPIHANCFKVFKSVYPLF